MIARCFLEGSGWFVACGYVKCVQVFGKVLLGYSV